MTAASYTTIRRKRLKARGLCVDCGRSRPRATGSICQTCHDRRLDSRRLARKRARPDVNSARIDRMIALAFGDERRRRAPVGMSRAVAERVKARAA